MNANNIPFIPPSQRYSASIKLQKPDSDGSGCIAQTRIINQHVIKAQRQIKDAMLACRYISHGHLQQHYRGVRVHRARGSPATHPQDLWGVQGILDQGRLRVFPNSSRSCNWWGSQEERQWIWSDHWPTTSVWMAGYGPVAICPYG